jgi:4-hydroxythreonine-4-phosphate dehydrogenase
LQEANPVDLSAGAGSRSSDRLRIAITMGDPRGVGPEVTEKALQRFRETRESVEWVVLGASDNLPFTSVDQRIELGNWQTGDPASAGGIAARAIERAVALALNHEVAGIVTAPIDKSALHAAGYRYAGHTEMLADLTGRENVAMLMCAEHTRLGGALRVVLATTHLPLAGVLSALTEDLLVAQARLTWNGLREYWQMAEPRLVFCAVNPHASDGGLFGDEEQRIVRPAIQRLSAEGITVAGPLSADTVFLRALAGEFDAVIAPYHDVGMAAFKTASFGRGVNVTLGLPFPRTSPDHGTALDIAGRGIADASSMFEALELAVRLARCRHNSVATLQ